MRKLTARLSAALSAFATTPLDGSANELGRTSSARSATVVHEPDSTGDMTTSYVQPEDAPTFPVRRPWHPLFPAQNSPESFYPTNVPPMPTTPVEIIDNEPVEAVAMQRAGLAPVPMVALAHTPPPGTPAYAPLGDPGQPGRRY